MKGSRVLFLCAVLATGSASAQSQSPATSVMKEDQVTQQALIDALAPQQQQAAEQPVVRTRSLRVSRADPAATVPAPPAKANLLITFDTNSARLTPEARKALDVVAQAFVSDRLASQRFQIEGHADPRGASEANLKLSRERAEAVRDYLSSKGVDLARLQPVGKGDRELLKPADPSAPENRRVTFVTVK
jgi:outer membrane protein OmpA-like peptidoglycan-associated protein